MGRRRRPGESIGSESSDGVFLSEVIACGRIYRIPLENNTYSYYLRLQTCGFCRIVAARQERNLFCARAALDSTTEHDHEYLTLLCRWRSQFVGSLSVPRRFSHRRAARCRLAQLARAEPKWHLHRKRSAGPRSEEHTSE